MHSLGKTINELHAMLKRHEQNLPKNNAPALHAIRAGKVQKVNKHKKSQPQMAARGQNHRKGKNKQTYAPKPKIPPPPKREDPGNDSIYSVCPASKAGASSDHARLSLLQAERRAKVNKHKKSQPQMVARGQNHRKGKNKQTYAPKPKIPPPPKREDPAKDSICHECGETGHWKRNFPQYLAELLKKKKNAASGAGGLGIFVIELNTILNKSWIYDTGCGTHICNTTQVLKASRKLKPGALSFNKRAKLDLDSAVLWHCRLGHISKKRIEKLQHDGLLDSTDL
nr:hypothetical protein [Tanacetum cinerariifolium]